VFCGELAGDYDRAAETREGGVAAGGEGGESVKLIPDCYIYYGKKNQLPDPRWRGRDGKILARAKGPGPRNVLVETELGTVVVPWGNVRKIPF
jgi:hypothetical protein